MQKIEVKNIRDFSLSHTYEAKSFEEFEKVESCVYQEILFADADLESDFCDKLGDNIAEEIKNKFADNYESRTTALSLINDYLDEIEIPDYVKPYTQTIYVALYAPLYYIEGEPEYISNVKYKNLVKRTSETICDAALEMLSEEAAERKEKEKLFEDCLNKYKEQYLKATTKTDKNKIISNCKLELQEELNEKRSKDYIEWRFNG